MTTLGVSSFSMHSLLGPLNVERRDESGALQQFAVPFERHISLEEFIAAARERLGVGAVELCQIQFQDSPEILIASLRSALDMAGVSLTAMPIDLGDIGQSDEAIRSEDIDRIQPWFEAAAALGATFVRVNAGAPSVEASEARWPALIDALGILADRAHALGMRLLIENHGGPSSEPDFMQGLIDAVGPDRLGLLLDLGNFDPLVGLSRARFFKQPAPDTDLDLEPVYATIARLAPIASLVHAKAIDPANDGAPLPDLGRALSIVASSGYRGPISVEWEGLSGDPWEQTRRVVDTVRSVFPALA